MSKPSSNILSNTYGAKEFSKCRRIYYQIITENAIIEMIDNTKDGSKKSVAVGAYDVKTGKVATSFAKEIPSIIHEELIKRANTIGGIGSHGVTDRNIVGVCAEFQVINKLLLSGSNISDIRLVKPVRPRTKEKIPFCANCQKMFEDIINKGEW